jgi:hypothetical protein
MDDLDMNKLIDDLSALISAIDNYSNSAPIKAREIRDYVAAKRNRYRREHGHE